MTQRSTQAPPCAAARGQRRGRKELGEGLRRLQVGGGALPRDRTQGLPLVELGQVVDLVEGGADAFLDVLVRTELDLVAARAVDLAEVGKSLLPDQLHLPVDLK